MSLQNNSDKYRTRIVHCFKKLGTRVDHEVLTYNLPAAYWVRHSEVGPRFLDLNSFTSEPEVSHAAT